MLTHLFLESLWKLGLLLVVVQVILIAVWSYRRTPRSATLVWIGFAAIPALIVLSLTIRTPRERIRDVCEKLAIAAEEEDVGGIVYHLATDFHADSIDHDEFKDLIIRAFKRCSFYNIRLSGFEFEMRSDTAAHVTFQATCSVESRDSAFDWLPTRWRLDFVRSGEAWRIRSLESIPVAPLHLRDLDRSVR